ncbi:MAG TPA: CpsB/CapC family capsule biosynthesis tyrosine phosphatase [Solirubrobacteraceae bacterium]|nr:CpsB/CapC family capsule biosynthesis tyrosine phosphatase [Solirubrobacteraceae bacterium]
MSYVDLHLHLLPGVDDGAQDEHDALVYARRLAVEGVREVTVTPHVSPSWPLEIATIPGRVADLQKAIDKRSLGVRLHAGGEIHPRSAAGLTDDELEILGHGPAGSRWLLLESPFGGVGDHFIGICDGLRARGYGLVIAHPERAGRLLDDGGLDLLRGQLRTGAVLQINVCSLLGNHGLSVQETAVHLLRSGLAYVIASDGHPGSRSQTLRLGFELAMRAGASSIQAWRLTQANPRFLLHQGIPQTSSPATAAALELMLD